MENLDVMQIIIYVVAIIFGGLTLWYKGNSDLRGKVDALIMSAEEMYKDFTKSGGKKFQWVVNQLYSFIPAILRPFVPHALVEQIVQTAFEAIQGYAKIQLDKLTDKITKDNFNNLEAGNSDSDEVIV